MAAPHGSRRGSLQFWPRKRAARIYPKISYWIGDSIQGFCGYKVGMTTVITISKTGKEIAKSATILEIPPVYTIGSVFYKKEIDRLRKVGVYINFKDIPKDLKKDLKRKFNYIKESNEDLYKDSVPNHDLIRILVATFPRKIKFKKTPEIFELGCDYDFEKARDLAGKELKIEDYFSDGDFVDVTAITKGKGTQGVIKRYGVKLRSHDSKKGLRRVGSVGSVTPRKIDWRVPMPGQMGFHQRTEYNKQILKISDKIDEINNKGGFKHYGVVRYKYVLVNGSVPGSRKRLIIIRKPKKKRKDIVQIKEIVN
ncbi:MAG: 50S ribosomal protein L3 [Candidatus Aenigmarchaeota archaeon ex4484_56]|nr:MAG: 50S ribosomal protein L3 [Candidatus Aenigmarchaeota archaeon ex4484_56]